MTQPEPQETEESITPLVLAALTAWLALVFPAVMATPVPNPSAIFQFERFWITQVDRLMPVLARLARRGWERTASELGVELRWDPSDPYLEEILAQTRNLLVGIPDRVYRDVVKSMAAGRDRGETAAQIRQRVDNILNINGSENWPHRAVVITRTELGRFTEAGGLAAARRVEQREQSVILKRWEDRDDDRVRRSHERVDNQLRRLGEPFQVGRSSLQFPIDPTGHPDDVVNCRCRLRFVRSGRG